MLAGGSGGGAWSQNVDCNIFPLHYTVYQSIKNVRNKMKKIRQTNFYTIIASIPKCNGSDAVINTFWDTPTL